jgi:hypothetical protein
MRGKLPLKVSPLLSSTSMGEPCAAVSSERGSCSLVAGDGGRVVPLCLFELWMTKMRGINVGTLADAEFPKKGGYVME